MSALGNLIVNLSMRTAEFESGTNRAVYMTNKLERDIEKSMKRLTTHAAAVGTALGQFAYNAARSLVSGINNAMQAADDVAVMAQKTGLGVEAIQELTYAAKLADVPLQSMANGMKILSKNAAEAAAGTKDQAQVFGAFEIKLRDASGALKSQEALLLEWADIFRDLPDGPEKTALAMKVFGKAGEEMIPLLNKGSRGIAELREEAKRFGFVVGEDAVKKLADFTDEMDRLEVAATSTIQYLAAEWIPWVNEMLEQFREGTKIAGGFWEAVFTFGTTTINPGNASEKIVQFRQEMADANKALADLKAELGVEATESDLGRSMVRQAEAKVATARMRKEFAQALERMNIARANAGKDFRDPRDRDDEGASKVRAAERAAQARKALADQSAAAEAERKRAAFAKELAEAVEKYDEAYRKVSASLAQGLQTEVEHNEQLTQEIRAIGKSKVELEALEQARLDSTIAKKEDLLATMRLAGEDEKHIRIVEREIAVLRARKRLRETKLNAEMENDDLNAADERARDKAKNESEALKARGVEIERTISDALMRGFERGEGFAENFVNTLRNLFKTQVIQIFLEPVVKSAIGAASDMFLKALGSAFGVGGVFGGTVADTGAINIPGGGQVFHAGGVVGSDSRPTRALGRGAFAGAPRLHGGLMPGEYPAILKKGEGVFTPAQMRALGGGGGITVNQTNVIDSRSDRETIERMLVANKEQTINEIRELRNRNDTRFS